MRFKTSKIDNERPIRTHANVSLTKDQKMKAVGGVQKSKGKQIYYGYGKLRQVAKHYVQWKDRQQAYLTEEPKMIVVTI